MGNQGQLITEDLPFARSLAAALGSGGYSVLLDGAPLDFIESLYHRYRHLASKPVYVLFSGGLDTSFLAHFLHIVIRAHVTAISVDVGGILHARSGTADRARVRADQLGVPYKRLDGRAFLLDPYLSCIRAEGQLFRGHHPASSLSRIAIVQSVLRFASTNPPVAVFHGSNGFQNNAFRFFNSFKHYGNASRYSFAIEAPHLDALFSRETAEYYLSAFGIPISRRDEGVYSQDDNIFGLEAEDATIALSSNAFNVEDTLLDCHPRIDSATRSLSIEFEDGAPAALETDERGWRTLGPLEILEELNSIGLQYRIGIHDYYEGRPIGIHAREIHISPGMTLLIRAHHLLKTVSLRPDLNRELERLSQLWSESVMASNLWTHPLRQEADEIFREYNKHINGTVSFRLGYQFIDLPRVHLKRNIGAGKGVSADQIASLYDHVHFGKEFAHRSNEGDAIRRVSAALDEIIRATYDYFA